MATRDDMIKQVISFGKKFPTYKSYGLATMDDIWSEDDKQGAIILQANNMQTCYLENKGDGHFEIKPMPLQAQQAPVYGMKSEDIDGDGNLDVLMVGNDYSMDPYSGRHDAFMGLCLKGAGKGNFTPVSLQQSGFFVNGDAKGLATVFTAKNESIIIATQNQDSVKVYSRNPASPKIISRWIKLNPDDFFADVVCRDGAKRRIEFYYGSTYLSQSSRVMPVYSYFKKITITNFNGVKREVPMK
jgi:hypothetical protein